MKSYLSLVPISARVHKRQSRMTRICIVLAVFLVTSIFSMAEMWIRAEQTAMINKHGNYHIILQDVQADAADQIKHRSDIVAFSEYGDINTDADRDYFINGKSVVLYGVEETYLADMMHYPVEGAYPQNDKDIALSADAKELFGFNIGDKVTLNTPLGNFDFMVSAFYEDDAELNELIDGCCAYMGRTAFWAICNLNEENVNPKYYIQFSDRTNLRKAIADIKEQFGLQDENIDENTAVLGLTGASSNETVQNVYPLALACFLLVLISGILMISSCMNSNVAQRTRFFGMMRCIGASKEQIVRFVRLEALNWCRSAIPAGCLLGMAVCWALCAILRLVVKGEFADMPLFGVSVSGIVCGIAVGIITVFMAAHSPARQAAKVSPIAAVSGNTEMEKTVRHAANTKLFKIETALGIHHATAAKKNLFLMTGSFAITIILFLAFSACLDIVHKLLPSESNFSPDVAIGSQENSNSIDLSLAEQLSKIPGVKNAFGTMYKVRLPVKINGIEKVIDLVSYNEFMLESAKKSVASGNLSKVYGDSGYVLSVFSENGRLDVGDKIDIGGHELEISCVVSEGIGSVSGSPVVVCSEETFMRLTGEQGYMMINMILEKGVSETDIDKIRNLAGSDSFIDRREEESEVYSSYWVFRFAAYGFLAIISFITALNIMNSVSMGVSARIKQYGAMRAVGMESRQLTRMIMGEAVTYAFCGMAAGIILGLILHYLIYVKIVVTHFGGTWKIPFSTIAVILLLVSVSCIAAVHAPAKRIRNMAITETINEL
ncbi:ABC transporter permease [Parablautia muri]|uniref:ABC transporter permease n=1 Tax=Parablautia muri TaxID=2320879 RepID=A0A9X5BGU8_9FIRM|nr:ABC transporter permease [Parablautia muri]NBJ93558.1 ABC transporter permease [Parablautia muri]